MFKNEIVNEAYQKILILLGDLDKELSNKMRIPQFAKKNGVSIRTVKRRIQSGFYQEGRDYTKKNGEILFN